ncbi:XrtA system polysaccharide deacetylase [Halosegnis marinus]|uniref:XrtA system polysaccharide deacetylase n=1 Tax=Halosegnis marinus TaxID=3034023 RepID=A0ABD5ZPY1_9EURY|nr:XrtA system polysaccharide deacetylase [Halosegnis sp. DT85]
MTYLLSFDVEDWFHAHNIRPAVSRDQWEAVESRVLGRTRRILELLSDYDVSATFFVLGWVAENHPEVVREIDRQGHEVASHGYNHELLYEQSPAEIRADIRRSIRVLNPLIQGEVDGYRAPSFSITDEAVQILADLELSYDSSSFPVTGHDRYGTLSMPSNEDIVTLDCGIQEVTLPQLNLGKRIPWAGGGYFRFIPYEIYRRGVERIHSQRTFVFYLHPWDIDPGQPRQKEIPLSYRLRHYTNLDRTEDRLRRLLNDFDWQPIGQSLS